MPNPAMLVPVLLSSIAFLPHVEVADPFGGLRAAQGSPGLSEVLAVSSSTNAIPTIPTPRLRNSIDKDCATLCILMAVWLPVTFVGSTLLLVLKSAGRLPHTRAYI